MTHLHHVVVRTGYAKQPRFVNGDDSSFAFAVRVLQGKLAECLHGAKLRKKIMSGVSPLPHDTPTTKHCPYRRNC